MYEKENALAPVHMPMPMRRLLTVDEVAEMLQVTRTTALRQARLGKIPNVRIGKQYRFAPAAIDAWVANAGHAA
jgi:excisionase family DNA binding protein